MSGKDKEQLLEKLAETHLAIRSKLNEVDLEMPVHKGSGWRAREILGHIATWDLETARSINAYRAGSEYSVTDLDDSEVDFNERAVLAQQKLSNQQVLDQWELAYDELKRSVQEIPIELFSGDMLYPWGSDRGSVTRLVEYMLEHAVEHRDEILNAIEA